MPKYGMVIDLQKCVGCGCCTMACKSENNTRTRANGQSYNWADLVIKTEGTFPKVKHTTLPVLCNHCTNAPCIENCPVTPKAMFKAEDNTTLHNQDRCIGCRACQMSCPYSHEQLDDKSLSGETYSVISFNFEGKDTQPQWTDQTELIKGFIKENAGNEELNRDFLEPLKAASKDLQAAMIFFMENGMKDPNAALAGSSDFMHLFGHVCLGWVWAQMARASHAALAADVRFAKQPQLGVRLRQHLPLDRDVFGHLEAGEWRGTGER